MQVIPVFAKDICHLKSYSEIVGKKNTRENIDCGLKMLRNCYERQHGSESQKWRGSLLCFNGGTTYPDQVLSKMGQIVLEGEA